MSASLSFFVPGIPAPQGSKTRTKFGVREDNPATKPWRQDVMWHAKEALNVAVPFAGAVVLEIQFRFPRLKAHYRTNGELKPSAPMFKTTAPDVDKLARAICDALTVAGVWSDDALVVGLHCTKRYDDEPGAQVLVYDADDFTRRLLQRKETGTG